jgi:hypothetical protein
MAQVAEYLLSKCEVLTLIHSTTDRGEGRGGNGEEKRVREESKERERREKRGKGMRGEKRERREDRNATSYFSSCIGIKQAQLV